MPNHKNAKKNLLDVIQKPQHIYIGFTTLDLDYCWDNIKSQYIQKYNIKYFILISNIDDWYIQLEEYCPCNTKREANEAKTKVIRSFDKVLNYNSKIGMINSNHEYNL